jgi:kynureninase
MNQIFDTSEACAINLDKNDTLAYLRNKFDFPKFTENIDASPKSLAPDALYFCGHSLGLRPKKAKEYINEELDAWAQLGVEGHFHAKHPWMPYHEFVTKPVANLVGALPSEVVTMNTLSVNLHLMMVSFYRPTASRYKIIVEAGAFPSDQYAVASQIKFHGLDPKTALIELKPKAGQNTLQLEDILEAIKQNEDSLALVMMGNVNYLTGQFYDIAKITQAGHAAGAIVGFDLAHGAGNLYLQLHDWNVDFAVWCNYKYINGGPGTIASCFVHERHGHDQNIPRFAGWWGHDKETRFKMGPEFKPISGAEGWQLSNPPIFQLAALRASLEIFEEAGIKNLREKSVQMTGYFEYLLKQCCASVCDIVTPANSQERGAMLCLRMKAPPQKLVEQFKNLGIIADFRNPDILRMTPAPLYTRYLDIYKMVQIIKEYTHA